MASRSATTTRLAVARLAAGYQQRELAELINLSAARLCEYERGVRPPEARQRALAAQLGYDAQTLFPENFVLDDEDVRAWMAGGPLARKCEEPAARPTPRDHADVGGGHDAG